MPSLKPNGKRLNGKGSKWITKPRRLGIYLRDGFTCGYCGLNLVHAHARDVTLDHLTPQCEGGSHDSDNLITACGQCNFRRQHRPWRQWVREVNPELAQVLVDRINRLRRRKPNTELAKAILEGRVSRQEALR